MFQLYPCLSTTSHDDVDDDDDEHTGILFRHPSKTLKKIRSQVPEPPVQAD